MGKFRIAYFTMLFVTLTPTENGYAGKLRIRMLACVRYVRLSPPYCSAYSPPYRIGSRLTRVEPSGSGDEFSN
jgi:hypothetical protein